MEDLRQPPEKSHVSCLDTAVTVGMDGPAFAMVLDIIGDRDYPDSFFDYRDC